MRRRFSSRTSSEMAGQTSLRSASMPPSRSSLGRQNSSQSSWHTSARNGVSIGSITVMSPSRPLSVSGSMGGIRYLPSVSSTTIPITRARLINTSMRDPQKPQRFVGTSVPRVCNALRAADAANGVGASSSWRAVREPTGAPHSTGLLSNSRSSFSSGGRAFMHFSSRVLMSQATPTSSHPDVDERMRKSTRAFLSGTEDCTATRRPTLRRSTSTVASISPGGSTTQLDTKPRIFASAEAAARQGKKELVEPKSTERASSADDVGKALFSQWTSKKSEPFSDLFQGRKDFFADLLKQRTNKGNGSRSHSQKWNGGSSRSEPFMTTISEIAEKDFNETSVDKYMAQSMVEPSTTNTLKIGIAGRSLPRTLISSVTTIHNPTVFDSDELFKALDTKRPTTEAESERTSKEMVVTAAENQNGKLVEYGSTTSVITEAKTEPELVSRSRTDTVEQRETGTYLLVATDDKQSSSTLAAGAQIGQDKKASNLLGKSTWSTEKYGGYVPVLTDSSSEVTGVTSGDHKMVPRSLDGPATMFSEMTEFSVFDVSKMSEPETPKAVLQAQTTDDHKEKIGSWNGRKRPSMT